MRYFFLRRVASHLVLLVVVAVLISLDSGLGGGFHYAVWFSPTRCVVSSSSSCCCCCCCC